jgi:hypothetical protein
MIGGSFWPLSPTGILVELAALALFFALVVAFCAIADALADARRHDADAARYRAEADEVWHHVRRVARPYDWERDG